VGLRHRPVPRAVAGTGLTLTTASAAHSVLVTVVVIFVAAALLHGSQLLEAESMPRADPGGGGS